MSTTSKLWNELRAVDRLVAIILTVLPFGMYAGGMLLGARSAYYVAAGILIGYAATLLAWFFAAKFEPHEHKNLGWFVLGACAFFATLLFQSSLLVPSHLFGICGGAALLFFNMKQP